MQHIYIVEYYSAIEKNEIMPFATTWMQLEILTLNEMSERERRIPYEITSKWTLQHKRFYLQDRSTFTAVENILVVA